MRVCLDGVRVWYTRECKEHVENTWQIVARAKHDNRWWLWWGDHHPTENLGPGRGRDARWRLVTNALSQPFSPSSLGVWWGLALVTHIKASYLGLELFHNITGGVIVNLWSTESACVCQSIEPKYEIVPHNENKTTSHNHTIRSHCTFLNLQTSCNWSNRTGKRDRRSRSSMQTKGDHSMTVRRVSPIKAPHTSWMNVTGTDKRALCMN